MVKVPEGLGHVFLCLELAHNPAREYPAVTLIASVPGREDTYKVRWHCPEYIPSADQMTDIVHRIAGLVTDAVVMYCGTQEVLPLT